jgi:ribosomal protein S21
MGIRVVVAENEPIHLALRRLKIHSIRSGVSWEIRRRQAPFVKATAKRRAKKFAKRFKARKATLHAKLAGEQPTSLSSGELLEEFWSRSGKK